MLAQRTSGESSTKNLVRQGRRGDCGYVITAVTHCPGEISCSGHGVCSGSPTYTCECSDGWQGADCSLKTCPSGKSWFMRPTAEDVAHLTRAECSDMGTCDRVSGECACVAGFEGAACDRMSCPGTTGATTAAAESDAGGAAYAASGTPCNAHGQCVTMSMLAEATDENGVATDYTYGGTPNNPLTWDHDMVQVCRCFVFWCDVGREQARARMRLLGALRTRRRFGTTKCRANNHVHEKHMLIW